MEAEADPREGLSGRSLGPGEQVLIPRVAFGNFLPLNEDPTLSGTARPSCCGLICKTAGGQEVGLWIPLPNRGPALSCRLDFTPAGFVHPAGP